MCLFRNINAAVPTGYLIIVFRSEKQNKNKNYFVKKFFEYAYDSADQKRSKANRYTS